MGGDVIARIARAAHPDKATVCSAAATAGIAARGAAARRLHITHGVSGAGLADMTGWA
jgi:hypothetical protein